MTIYGLETRIRYFHSPARVFVQSNTTVTAISAQQRPILPFGGSKLGGKDAGIKDFLSILFHNKDENMALTIRLSEFSGKFKWKAGKPPFCELPLFISQTKLNVFGYVIYIPPILALSLIYLNLALSKTFAFTPQTFHPPAPPRPLAATKSSI